MPRVLLKEIECGEIAPEGVEEVGYNGVVLSRSKLIQSLPILGLSVLNNSTAHIRVSINETTNNAFRVSPGGSRPLDGVPFWDISVENLSTTDTISAGEVVLTLVNDMEQCMRYDEAKSRGITQ